MVNKANLLQYKQHNQNSNIQVTLLCSLKIDSNETLKHERMGLNKNKIRFDIFSPFAIKVGIK